MLQVILGVIRRISDFQKLCATKTAGLRVKDTSRPLCYPVLCGHCLPSCQAEHQASGLLVLSCAGGKNMQKKRPLWFPRIVPFRPRCFLAFIALFQGAVNVHHKYSVALGCIHTDDYGGRPNVKRSLSFTNHDSAGNYLLIHEILSVYTYMCVQALCPSAHPRKKEIGMI